MYDIDYTKEDDFRKLHDLFKPVDLTRIDDAFEILSNVDFSKMSMRDSSNINTKFISENVNIDTNFEYNKIQKAAIMVSYYNKLAHYLEKQFPYSGIKKTFYNKKNASITALIQQIILDDPAQLDLITLNADGEKKVNDASFRVAVKGITPFAVHTDREILKSELDIKSRDDIFNAAMNWYKNEVNADKLPTIDKVKEAMVERMENDKELTKSLDYTNYPYALYLNNKSGKELKENYEKNKKKLKKCGIKLIDFVLKNCSDGYISDNIFCDISQVCDSSEISMFLKMNSDQLLNYNRANKKIFELMDKNVSNIDSKISDIRAQNELFMKPMYEGYIEELIEKTIVIEMIDSIANYNDYYKYAVLYAKEKMEHNRTFIQERKWNKVVGKSGIKAKYSNEKFKDIVRNKQYDFYSEGYCDDVFEIYDNYEEKDSDLVFKSVFVELEFRKKLIGIIEQYFNGELGVGSQNYDIANYEQALKELKMDDLQEDEKLEYLKSLTIIKGLFENRKVDENNLKFKKEKFMQCVSDIYGISEENFENVEIALKPEYFKGQANNIKNENKKGNEEEEQIME